MQIISSFFLSILYHKFQMNNLVPHLKSKHFVECVSKLPNNKLNSEFSRSISISSILQGRRNFRKFIYQERGTPLDRKWFRENPDKVDQRGARPTGYWSYEKKHPRFVEVPDMVPEIIVPDLSNFNLKPYVSYRTAAIEQEKFTPEHLFYAVYAKKLKKDFDEGKLDEHGNSLEPSEEEKMTVEEAWQKGRSTGSDLFG